MTILLLGSLPGAHALEGLDRVSPGRVGPEDTALTLEWVLDADPRCEDARSTVAAEFAARRPASRDDASGALCGQAGAALAPLEVPAQAASEGIAAAAPLERDADLDAVAVVDVAGASFGAQLGDAPAAPAAALTPPTVLDGARDDVPPPRPPLERAPALARPVPIPAPAGPVDAEPVPTARLSTNGAPAPAPPSPAADAPTLAAIRATATGLALALLAFLLYQRMARHEALQHPGRARLFELLVADGAGSTVADLATRAGIPRKTAEYHLLYLARAGLVREHVREGAARQWTTSVTRPTPTVDERILAAVQANAGLSTGRLAQLTGLTRSCADRHAKALVLKGALEARTVERERCFFVAG